MFVLLDMYFNGLLNEIYVSSDEAAIFAYVEMLYFEMLCILMKTISLEF